MAAFPGRPDPWQTLAKLFVALVAAGVLVAGLALPYVGGLGLVAGREADKFQNTQCDLPDSKPPQKTTLVAKDGKTVVATLFKQDRVPVPLSQVPTILQQALVATEDRRFYSHHGVDLRGLIRSAINTSNGDTQGGSTLTMQYVKQLRYYQAGDNLAKQRAAIAQNINRKIEDAKCALYIEETLGKSKSQILDDYLNIAFFGEHSYGIQTAAETYFDKPSSQLTLGESALLVGMLRAPSDYDPFLHRAAATERRNEVLQNLVSVHKLSQAHANSEKAKPISLSTKSPPQVRQGCANTASKIANVNFFCEYAVNWLQNVDGISDTELQTGGLKIVTTLDPKLQNTMQAKLAKAIPATSAMTAVLPAIDPKTGNVLAMATSKTFGDGKGQTEQPVFTAQVANGASTFKLFPLLSALSVGVPSTWPLLTTANGNYQPKYCATKKPGTSNGDADESYSDQETLDSATAKSSNTFFLGLADQLFNCQLDPMVSLAQKLGIGELSEPDGTSKLTVAQAIESQQRAQQFVLGSVPVSPLELAGAYAAVANGGKYNAPAPILSVTDSGGSALALKRKPGVQVVAPETAAQAVKILSGDTEGDGTSAGEFDSWYSDDKSTVAGKTGTVAAVGRNGKETSKNAAVWFVGMTPDLVATSALINFDYPNRASTGLPGQKTGTAYGNYASKVWLKALGSTLGAQSWTWETPDDVSGQDVPDLTGMSLSEARTAVEGKFTIAPLSTSDSLRCPASASVAPYDSIAFYGPHKAPEGSTILVCQSLGTLQSIYVPQPKRTKPKPRTTRPGGTTTGSGNGTGTGTGGTGTGGTGTGGTGGTGTGGTGTGGTGTGGTGTGGTPSR
ncbi:transglycosylase domain-containing protein [uncultured Jatrophihabitans sp.]|uniref:transglycosylase domain-containing protein n=1 Tax=uncultured Jatrophihabitans sp. TaxID=1610747 RepID=UPI0035CA0CE2